MVDMDPSTTGPPEGPAAFAATSVGIAAKLEIKSGAVASTGKMSRPDSIAKIAPKQAATPARPASITSKVNPKSQRAAPAENNATDQSARVSLPMTTDRHDRERDHRNRHDAPERMVVHVEFDSVKPGDSPGHRPPGHAPEIASLLIVDHVTLLCQNAVSEVDHTRCLERSNGRQRENQT
jgi:hypothetical protein